MSKDPHRYDDMLYLPHHRSNVHPHMSRYNRAAQFAPFAALTGYEDAIVETARLTDMRPEADENEKEELDRKFAYLIKTLELRKTFSFSVFVADALKEGGSIQTIKGIVKKIDPTLRQITLYHSNGVSDGQCIFIDDILDIEETQ